MIVWVFGNKCTDGVTVWKVGCACSRPRRRKEKIEATEELINKIKECGSQEEVR